MKFQALAAETSETDKLDDSTRRGDFGSCATALDGEAGRRKRLRLRGFRSAAAKEINCYLAGARDYVNSATR